MRIKPSVPTKIRKYFTLQIFSFPQISPVLHKYIYFHLFRHHTSFVQLNFSIYLFTLPVLHLILLFYFGEHLLCDCFAGLFTLFLVQSIYDFDCAVLETYLQQKENTNQFQRNKI